MRGLVLLILGLGAAWGDVTQCACDPARPETMAARECGLCREAEKHPADMRVFFLKDINPRKPNRWLALPRAHQRGQHALADMTPTERTELWRAAMERARQMFGDQWGLAINGDRVRTQCHAHIHLGRLIEGVETDRYLEVERAEQIPAPADGSGFWVHPQGGKLHVHVDEELTETVLLR